MKRPAPISKTQRHRRLLDRTTSYVALPVVRPSSRLFASQAVAPRSPTQLFVKAILARVTRLFCLVVIPFTIFQFNGIVNAQPHGQTAQFEQNPEKRSRVFEAVEGMQVEEVSGTKMLLVAYALFWLLLFAYVVRLARIQDRTRDDIIRLERLLSKLERAKHGEDKPAPE